MNDSPRPDPDKPVDLSCMKPQIDYPTRWGYKIIAASQQQIVAAVAEILGDAQRSLVASHASSGGKYHSMGLEIVVHSEQHRLEIFESLKNHPDIRFVL